MSGKAAQDGLENGSTFRSGRLILQVHRCRATDFEDVTDNREESVQLERSASDNDPISDSTTSSRILIWTVAQLSFRLEPVIDVVAILATAGQV
jgi:hypothetical protein